MIRSKTGKSLGGGDKRIQFTHTYEDIISVENLLAAWQEFVRGKKQKADVQEFHHRLMDNIFALHTDLKQRTYHHGGYHAFRINDPKPRDIHKPSVRDRLLHHALYRQLYPFFDRAFIAHSYSCRLRKGTHRAMNRFRTFAYRSSKNHTRTIFVLKCDVRKFFASIDQRILMEIVSRYIPDANTMWLIGEIIHSFKSDVSNKGLPLGNLTSQLLVNVYMNEFDQFVTHTLKARHYIRYADDFIILSHNRTYLYETFRYIERFLQSMLALQLHPNKVSIKTFDSGVDFLGWVHFPNHRVLRTTTKRRVSRRMRNNPNEESTQSYLGLLSHGNTRKFQEVLSHLLNTGDR